MGEDGIFRKAQDATKIYENAQNNEMISLEEISNYIDDVNKGNINSGEDEEQIKENIPNKPRLKQGMTAVKFNEPTQDSIGTMLDTNENDNEWYNYEEKKWANARTEDGSMWVWIPRFAYRINESNQTVDVVFLQGTSNNYYDENGILREAKRCKNADDIIDTTEGFTVHPAFTDESSIGFRNGGWDSEIEGIWVAKFEAGYATGGENTASIKASNVNYTQTQVWSAAVENGTSEEGSISARNWLDGIYGETTTAIKYPTFQGSAYSMNYISTGDAYSISRVLTEAGNIYGIYDISGGVWERTTGYINNGNENLSKYGNSFVTGTSNKYSTVYPYSDEGTNNTEKEQNNYELNTKIYGDAIKETSKEGTGNSSWYEDYSYYLRSNGPFFKRGGFYEDDKAAGIIAFHPTDGYNPYKYGFRCILI